MRLGDRDLEAVRSHRSAETRCEVCPIRRRAVCAYCEPDDLEELDSFKSYRRFEAGETIAWAGERMSMVGSVVTGVAMLSRTLADGRRQMVGLLLPSDFLGRPGRAQNAYDVVAATETVFCMFQKPEFERLVARMPQIERRLLQMTLDELDSAREWMLLLGRKTAREKIASLFVIMARRDAALQREPKPGTLVFPLYITREAMADYLGLTIETVSRQISALRRDGVVELCENRTVRVPDLLRLIDESGDDADGGVLS
ncbi:transcriptional regulator FnrL [Amaricoccus sp.]|uniref:transcriptional regulator FnrL n=1 Tax=Amaricoccus sp. TaxID=1872485 RepID=UPI001B471A9D|nr:Crp/Fnr family transcriptional regulator [Amaricoccus sp.]MBP7242079.1 Crp/Fnr family transcriptional regulator [Amaricoccus sp.]